jgi:hypothetical protein
MPDADAPPEAEDPLDADDPADDPPLEPPDELLLLLAGLAGAGCEAPGLEPHAAADIARIRMPPAARRRIRLRRSACRIVLYRIVLR